MIFFLKKQAFLFVYALIAFGWTLQINIHLKNLIFGTEWWKHKTWWTKKLKCQRKIRTLLVLDFVLIVRLFVSVASLVLAFRKTMERRRQHFDATQKTQHTSIYSKTLHLTFVILNFIVHLINRSLQLIFIIFNLQISQTN